MFHDNNKGLSQKKNLYTNASFCLIDLNTDFKS